MSVIPDPSLERLCVLFGVLEELDRERVPSISSRDLGALIDVPHHTIRKDINFLGGLGPSPAGYEVSALRMLIGEKLELFKINPAGILGLDNLGCAYLQNNYFASFNCPIVAGFDSNMNTLELIKSDLPLFPLNELQERVVELGIKILIITKKEKNMAKICASLVHTGLEGIINVGPYFISPATPPGASYSIKNLNIIKECRVLTGKKHRHQTKEECNE